MIADELIESGGELTEGLETALSINQDQLQEKAVQLAMIVKDLDYQVDYCKAEIERITKIKKAAENAQNRLVFTIGDAMKSYGILEIRSEALKLSFRKSEAVVITNEALIPGFLKEQVVTEKIDKAELKKLIKEGTEIPGAEIEIRQNLTIK